MNWITFALFTIFLYGIHDILLKRLSGTHAVAASLIINISAAAGLLCVLVMSWLLDDGKRNIRITGSQVLWLALAGLCLGMATVTFMKSFSKGAFSIVLPFVYVGIIVLSVVVGMLLFKEKLTYIQMMGVALAYVGLVLMVRK